jgi:formylglycine-generating enzyme required for sulfatase activity
MDNAVNGTLRRVARGGSWYNDQIYARAAYRFRSYPDSWLNIRGFRVACRPPSP